MQDNNAAAGDAAAGRDAPRKRRIIPFAILTVVVIGAVGYGIYWWLSGRFYESTDDAYVGGNVTVISPRVSGYVARVLVADNALVHAGQPLIELDPADFTARLDAAQAEVDAAKAALTRLDAQHQLVEADIAQAQAQADVDTASLQFANRDAERYSNLAESHSGTQQDSQRAQTSLDQARARVRASAAAVNAQRRQLTVIEAQKVEAQARVEQAQASMRNARLDNGYTTLYAPVDGYVGNRSAHPGTYVAAGTQLMSLVPAKGLWIDANFKEDQIRHMRMGQAVEIEADVDSGLKIEGHVESLAPATGSVFSVIPAQNATGNFTKIVQRVPVRIALDPAVASVGALRAGLSVVATVDTRSVAR
ncbi:HlyD family secretion protein [Burkholderia gladioli]|uniref:HlyD family secretion protein n=1 Tax=Burkholderia gladioli TaxID=28095 RepID=UPI00164003C7|nr:HlyD family secretion protein [Burkholderia gladioli]MBU9218735.1 HlyD family secretion protein [Burkholderia gladioli]MDN7727260.1 HlyD family secretion protein [Burkholderia gladioli]